MSQQACDSANCAGIGTCKIVREQPERYGGEAGTDQGDDLGGEEMAIGPVGENLQHGHRLCRSGVRLRKVVADAGNTVEINPATVAVMADTRARR